MNSIQNIPPHTLNQKSFIHDLQYFPGNRFWWNPEMFYKRGSKITGMGETNQVRDNTHMTAFGFK